MIVIFCAIFWGIVELYNSKHILIFIYYLNMDRLDILQTILNLSVWEQIYKCLAILLKELTIQYQY